MINKMLTLKCVEITSQRQADNGTVSYYDPQARVYYNLYENGYVRRSFGRIKMSNGRWSDERIYQLNPTKMVQHAFNRHDGYPYTVSSKSRIKLESHEERMECAARGVINYRNTCKKYEQQAKEHAEKLKSWRENRYLNLVMVDIQDSANQYFEGNISFVDAMNNIQSSLEDAKHVLHA
jgi:hypothetical protein